MTGTPHLEAVPGSPPPRRGRPPIDHAHGTAGRYAKGCRCEVCRAGNRDRGRAWRAAKRANGDVFTRGVRRPGPRRNNAEAPHGTEARYSSPTWRCRCDECRAGHAAYKRGRRAAQRGESGASQQVTRVSTTTL